MANICPCTFGNSVAGALFNLKNVKERNAEGPEQSASATVLSRRVDTCYSLLKSDSSWAYLVTFRLENGEEVELKTTEAEYGKLKEGKAMTITWKGEELVSFIITL